MGKYAIKPLVMSAWATPHKNTMDMAKTIQQNWQGRTIKALKQSTFNILFGKENSTFVPDDAISMRF
jgi:hypothetical protein